MKTATQNSKTKTCQNCQSAKRVSASGCRKRWCHASAYAEVAVERWGNRIENIQFRQGWSDDRKSSDVRCRSDVRCLGDFGHRMNNTSSRWRWSNWSNPSDFVDGNGGEDGGKLDPHVSKKMHGSNPTKLHHTNKSQKKLGAIFGGGFRI